MDTECTSLNILRTAFVLAFAPEPSLLNYWQLDWAPKLGCGSVSRMAELIDATHQASSRALGRGCGI